MAEHRPIVEFSLSRFALTAALIGALGIAFTAIFKPDERFDPAEVAASVEIRVVPRLAPTAESVRRRALSNESLFAVWKELSADFDASATPQVERDDELASWRKHLSVDVRTIDADRRRLRFVWSGGGDRIKTERIVQAVAARYASDVSAERWYASVDRLRTAQEAAETAIEELLVVTNGSTTASQYQLPRAPVPSPQNVEVTDIEGEIIHLMRVREQMLLSLQPAHPEIVALDDRLAGLRTIAMGTPIRRLSGEDEGPNLTPSPRLASSGLSLSAATAKVQRASAEVEARLAEMLAPAAAEFPVVTTNVPVLKLWNLREAWYAAALLPAFVAAFAVARVQKTMPTATAAPQPIATAIVEPAPTIVPHVAVMPPKQEVVLNSPEQVAVAAGTPVLGVIRFHRDSMSC